MDYNKLSLVELKNICKSKNLQYGGTKSQLIKRIVEFEKPLPVIINDHKGFNLPKDKKIVGIKMGDTEKSMRISKEIEKNTGVPVVSVTYDGTGGNKNNIIIPYLKYPRHQKERELINTV